LRRKEVQLMSNKQIWTLVGGWVRHHAHQHWIIRFLTGLRLCDLIRNPNSHAFGCESMLLQNKSEHEDLCRNCSVLKCGNMLALRELALLFGCKAVGKLCSSLGHKERTIIMPALRAIHHAVVSRQLLARFWRKPCRNAIRSSIYEVDLHC